MDAPVGPLRTNPSRISAHKLRDWSASDRIVKTVFAARQVPSGATSTRSG